jgi:HEAT repeat protein
MSNVEADQLSGYEPQLSITYGKRGQQRLSLRGLATSLKMLPPNLISLDVTAQALHSDAFYVRHSAGEALARRADREARLVLQDALTDERAPVRASAARHLYGFSWFSVEPLIRQALGDQDRVVREAVVYALCAMRDLNAYETLTEALQHEDDDVRAAAAFGLRDCQDTAAVPVLEAVLLADDPQVRVKALEALAANDTRGAIPPVRRAMHDSQPDVIYAATLSLLELIGEESLLEIADVIQHSDGERRAQVLTGFFHASNYLKFDVADSAYVDPLIDALAVALQDRQLETRRAAIWPVAWIKHPRTPPLLQQAYNNEADSTLKALFMRVAVSLMADNSETLLTDALHSQDEIVRAAAEKIMRERAQRTTSAVNPVLS